MKRVTVWCLVGLLAIAVGCGKKGDEVIRLKAVPEIDSSALQPYVEFGPGEISKDALWVILKGEAKQDLGERLQVNVTRYTAAGRLDTVPAYVTLENPPAPEMPARPEPGAAGEGPAGPELGPGPPPPPTPIKTGDKVTMSVDATTNQGVITKLVMTPMGVGR